MKNKLNKTLNTKVKAVGGVYFLTVNILAVFLMVFVISMSKISLATSISNNLAHVVCTKIAINAYNTGSGDFSGSGDSGIETADGRIYYPNIDFYNMAKDYGIAGSIPTGTTYSWDKNEGTAELQIGKFSTFEGKIIKPQQQKTRIENE